MNTARHSRRGGNLVLVISETRSRLDVAKMRRPAVTPIGVNESRATFDIAKIVPHAKARRRYDGTHLALAGRAVT
jgi:hypothetical protein